jgi:N6-adenosine-specific RNA methylase IME4
VSCFGSLPLMSYDLIMADPPWSFKTFSDKGHAKAAQAHYDCMTLDDIKALPVSHLAKQDCLLWLWCTNPMLTHGIENLRSWGFTFKTAGHWVKKTKHGKLAFGTGYILRSAGEPFLIGTIGSPKTSRSVRSVVEGRIREHSRKPEEAYQAAEQLIPDARRLDLFSREKRMGWDNWGRESEKFNIDQQLAGAA